MVRLKNILITVILLLMMSTTSKAAVVKVIDNAGLFSPSEIQSLTEEAERMSKEYDMDVGIATTNDAKGMSTMVYTEHFYEERGFGSNGSGILIMYDMDNREIFINTEGRAIDIISDKRVESLLDSVFDNGLGEGRYYDSARSYLKKLNGYLRGNYLSPLDMGLSALGALGAGGGFFGATKARYKVKTKPHPFDFRRNSIVNFANIDDPLIDTNVVTRRIPRNTGGGGRGGGGSTTRTSSTGSGRTYGGGGRKF